MKSGFKLAATALLCGAIAVPTYASHSWNNYHWAKPGAKVTVPIERNLSSEWHAHFYKAVSDWNADSNFPTVIGVVEGTGSVNPRTCKPVGGRIEVCNSSYGRTGWLGIAQIWLSNGHISQAVTKLNDTYFNTAKYNTFDWRALVICQEIGHDFGLGHQDEDFANADLPLGGGVQTCMDYTNVPAGNGQPNDHDYEQLALIYSHADSAAAAVASYGVSQAPGGDTPGEWGRAIHFTKDGRPDQFEQILGPGNRKITHVFWAIGEGPRGSKG